MKGSTASRGIILAGLAICLSGTASCTSTANREPERVDRSATIRPEPARQADVPRRDSADTQSTEEARKKTEADYREFLERRKKQEEQVRRDEQQARDRQEREQRAADEELRRKSEEQRLSDELALLREQARASRERDRIEEADAARDALVFERNVAEWKKAARAIEMQDSEEVHHAQTDAEDFRLAREREQEFRKNRLDKADPERSRFYRVDSERLFPGRLIIAEVVSRGFGLYRNRQPLQFMAIVPAPGKRNVTAVPLPVQERPMRLHLYDFLKGRPGDYVLLDAAGSPADFQSGGKRYRIVNIHSDGSVLLLVDLEREDLGEYHRISVQGIDLLLE